MPTNWLPLPDVNLYREIVKLANRDSQHGSVAACSWIYYITSTDRGEGSAGQKTARAEFSRARLFAPICSKSSRTRPPSHGMSSLHYPKFPT